MLDSFSLGESAWANSSPCIIALDDGGVSLPGAPRCRLEQLGATVLTARQPAELAALLKRRPAAAILVPQDKSGDGHLELCRLAKHADPDTVTIVVYPSPDRVPDAHEAVDEIACVASPERLAAQVDMLLTLRAYNVRATLCRAGLADQMRSFGLSPLLLEDDRLPSPGRVDVNGLVGIGEIDRLLHALCSAYGVVYSLYYPAAGPQPVENWPRRAAAQQRDVRPLCGMLQQLAPLRCARAQRTLARAALASQHSGRCRCWAGMTLVAVPIAIRFRGASSARLAAVFQIGNVPPPERVAALAEEFGAAAGDLHVAAGLSRAWRRDASASGAPQHTEQVCRAVEALADSVSRRLSDKYATAYNILVQTVERWERGHAPAAPGGTDPRLREVDRLRNEFLANISHDLRSPITSILGFSGLLGGDKPISREHQARCLTRIDAGARDLMDLLDNVLGLSRMMAVRSQLCIEPCALDEVVQDCLDWVRPRARGRSVELRWVPTGVELRTDRAKLRQILANLLANAVRFPQNNCVVLTAEAEQADAAGERWLRLDVADRSAGIPPEQMAGLFEEFRHGGGQTAGSIGLVMVKRLTHLLGGTVCVGSGAGEGTTFTVRLPLDLDAHRGRQQQARSRLMADEARRQTPPAGGAALVVDADPATALQLRQWLEPDGLAVAAEVDPDAALHRTQSLRPAVVLVDPVTPDGDNWDLVAALTAESSGIAAPVVVVSAIENRRFAFALGAQAYLAKPLEREATVEALADIGFAAGAGAVTDEAAASSR